MENRVICLTKNNHKYVFRFDNDAGVDVIDEVARMARDPKVDLDWQDAATLAFQVAQHDAIDCCKNTLEPVTRVREISDNTRETCGDNDEAKDGPWTNTNCP